jgi:hypothetical protein
MNVDGILLHLILDRMEPDPDYNGKYNGEYITASSREAAAVMYLGSINYVKILDGHFPETIFISFKCY